MFDFTELGLITTVNNVLGSFGGYFKIFLTISAVTFVGSQILKYGRNIVFPFIGGGSPSAQTPFDTADE